MEQLLYLFTQRFWGQSSTIQMRGFNKLHETFEGTCERRDKQGWNFHLVLYPEAFHLFAVFSHNLRKVEMSWILSSIMISSIG